MDKEKDEAIRALELLRIDTSPLNRSLLEGMIDASPAPPSPTPTGAVAAVSSGTEEKSTEGEKASAASASAFSFTSGPAASGGVFGSSQEAIAQFKVLLVGM
jgi:hypothetical protein